MELSPRERGGAKRGGARRLGILPRREGTKDQLTFFFFYSSTLAWKIPWTEEPGRLQFMRSLGVGHD